VYALRDHSQTNDHTGTTDSDSLYRCIAKLITVRHYMAATHTDNPAIRELLGPQHNLAIHNYADLRRQCVVHT